MLHLLPHWNWPGKEGQDIACGAFSNCEEVELFLNGQSLGKQTMQKNSHLEWKVKYAPGTLERAKVTTTAKSSLKRKWKRPAIPPPLTHARPPDHQCRRRGCCVVTVSVTTRKAALFRRRTIFISNSTAPEKSSASATATRVATNRMNSFRNLPCAKWRSTTARAGKKCRA